MIVTLYARIKELWNFNVGRNFRDFLFQLFLMSTSVKSTFSFLALQGCFLEFCPPKLDLSGGIYFSNLKK